nr:hypothetical protein BaRGS_027648 [Batillaria attramentaria]
MEPPAVTAYPEALKQQLSAMSAEIGQLRLTVAALSAELGERREPVSTPQADQEHSTRSRCYCCDQAGHFERACPAKQNYRRRKRPRRRRRQRKGQHQQAPPSAPPPPTTHHQKRDNGPKFPAAAPAGLAPRPVPTPVPAAEIRQTVRTATQQPPAAAVNSVTRTSSPGSGSKSSGIPAKAGHVTVYSVVKSVAPRSKRPETVRVKRSTQPAQQKVMWRP